jgi:hypothetical protein
VQRVRAGIAHNPAWWWSRLGRSRAGFASPPLVSSIESRWHMSERVVSFVENWVSENINAEGYPVEGDDLQAKRLAMQCMADAAADGIPKTEMDEEFDDLAAFMQGQIIETNDREVHRLIDKDKS